MADNQSSNVNPQDSSQKPHDTPILPVPESKDKPVTQAAEKLPTQEKSPESSKIEDSQVNPAAPLSEGQIVQGNPVVANNPQVSHGSNVLKSAVEIDSAVAQYQNTMDALTQKSASQQAALEFLEKKVKDSVDDAKNEIKDTKTLTVLGFIVMLIMVATLLVMVAIFMIQAFNEKTAFYEKLIERMNSYQEKMDSLKTRVIYDEEHE